MRYVAAGRHTFLFTDLVGFTALTLEHGDERAADVAVELYERVRPLAASHGAEEVKTIGDALMLRCDDPAKAVSLGVCVVESLEEVDGFPPVRVGMHTGPAVSRAGDWYGTTVNVAARLCAAAGGGEVLVSQATHDACGRLRGVEFDEHRLHWLKNVTEPVEACVASRPEPTSWRERAMRLVCPEHAGRMREVLP